MIKLKKNERIKARIFYNIFRLINDLNFINASEEFESSYSNIYPKKLQLDNND